jgi:type IV pilus assembly protein PilB
MLVKSRYKLGDILMEEGLITQAQLNQALEIQRREHGPMGMILIKLKIIAEQDLLMALSKQLKIPFASRGSGMLQPATDQKLDELVSADYAREHVLLPLSRKQNALTIAISDPLDLMTVDNLSKVTRCHVNPILATRTDILRGIEAFYGEDSLLKEAIDESYHVAHDASRPGIQDEDMTLDRLKAEAEDAPVVRLVDLVFRQAIKERASDIHIEPWWDRIGLRYRIDGVLYEITPPARSLHAAIVSRIKVLAKLDISERRLPQDGAFSTTLEGRQIDFRISTIPSLHGEKIVIRILDKSSKLMQLGQLGFKSKELDVFRKAVSSPYGMVLVTGPTGSGKTTTLYAALGEICSPKKNFLTIEDPVEYRLDGVTQVQVNVGIGLTFAQGLRSFMRQDPDVILVGEVRDLETAESCVRAALTGHMVFSTVHTNDAPTAVTRLVDIGIAPFLLSSTMSLVVAQRLLRKLCTTCREAYEPDAGAMKALGIMEQTPIYRAKACDDCNQLGYKGREAIVELMPMSAELRALISRGASAPELRAVAKQHGMVTLWENGVVKVLEGVTSVEELYSTVQLEANVP